MLALVGSANAQGIPVDRRPDVEIRGSYELREIHVEGTIRKQVAELQISQVFHNPTGRTIEAELLLPLPADGTVQDLVLMANGKEVPGELMSAEEARRVYESIVRRKRDPALLEYAGRGLFKTGVFPIPAGEMREVTMRYTQLCRREGDNGPIHLPAGDAQGELAAGEAADDGSAAEQRAAESLSVSSQDRTWLTPSPPSRSKTIRRIFRMYTREGRAYKAIVEALNAGGVAHRPPATAGAGAGAGRGSSSPGS